MTFKRFLYSSLALCVMPLLAWPAHATEPLSPRADVSVKGGTERNLFTTEFWLPLAQKNDQVLYTDIRLMGDDDANREGNLGVGYRRIVPKVNAVLGASAWIDRRRTKYGNHLHQTTIGFEALGDKLDVRNNYYIPLNGTKHSSTPNSGSATPYLAGSGIFFDTNGILSETPQFGVDGEVGYRLPVFKNHVDAFRVYAGGYHFFRDNTENVTGYRIRTEAQVNKALSVGLRFQHDAIRGSQGFVEATLRFPFSAKKLYQTDSLRSRLDESPERDVDIVTGSKVVDTGLRKPVLNAVSGATQRVLYVDNSAAGGGTGTKENPFNTLATAEAALQDNDVLYVNRGTGTTTGMNQGLVINKPGITLVGSGADFVWDSTRFTGSTGSPQNGTLIAAKTAAPVITNIQAYVHDGSTANTSNTGNGVMVTADNVYISGITVSSASASGIYVVAESGTEFSSVRISDVTTSNNVAGRGIMVSARNGGIIDTVSITNSTSTNHTGGGSSSRGIEVRSAAGNSLIRTTVVDNNTTTGNLNYGIFTYANNTGVLDNVTISRNTSSGNTNVGIYGYSFTNGRINDLVINNNTTSGNLNYGIWASSATSSQTGNVTLSDNTSSGNTNYGILASVSTGSMMGNVIMSGNTSINTIGAAGTGLYLGAGGTNGTMNSATVSGNTSINNGQNGMVFSASSATAVLNNINVSENNFTGNGGNGVYLSKGNVAATYNIDLGGGSQNSIGKNRIFGNTGTEIRVDSGYAASAKNNYWGGGDLAPGERTLNAGATIDTSGFLTTDPRP